MNNVQSIVNRVAAHWLLRGGVLVLIRVDGKYDLLIFNSTLASPRPWYVLYTIPIKDNILAEN